MLDLRRLHSNSVSSGCYTEEQTRKRDSRDRILQAVPMKLGEFHLYMLDLHG